MVTMDRPQAQAWFVDEPIADDDPLAPVKRRAVAARADRIDQAAALFADPAFDLEESYDVAEAVLPGADVNAASYIGLVLREVELNGGGGGD
jgi:hypothetical protein